MLEVIIADPALPTEPASFSANIAFQILRIAPEVVAGEIAAKQKDFDRALLHLERAVRFEETLVYTEPADWHAPVRQTLGAVLLQAGRPDEAEAVYWEDLKKNPENGWALFGLTQALRAQQKEEEAARRAPVPQGLGRRGHPAIELAGNVGLNARGWTYFPFSRCSATLNAASVRPGSTRPCAGGRSRGRQSGSANPAVCGEGPGPGSENGPYVASGWRSCFLVSRAAHLEWRRRWMNGRWVIRSPSAALHAAILRQDDEYRKADARWGANHGPVPGGAVVLPFVRKTDGSELHELVGNG